MSNEVKQLLEVGKPDGLAKATVGIRTELPKRIHKLTMRVHANNPRTWNFHDTLAEIIELGAKAKLEQLK